MVAVRLGAGTRATVIRLLDRPGLRWILAPIATLWGRLKGATLVRLYRRDGLWIHEYPDGFVVDRVIDTAHSLVAFDDQTRDAWEYLYRPATGDTVVDVGAGIGSEVHRYSRAVGPGGTVIAIEAHPETFRCLKAFCELNGLENVRLHNVAIGDCTGTAVIDEAQHHVSSSIIGGRDGVSVHMTTLDELIGAENAGPIAYLKMNIEGAEREAMHGMCDTLSHTRFVCVSCHDFRAEKGAGEVFRTRREVTDFLVAMGFRVAPRTDSRAWIADQVNAGRIDPGHASAPCVSAILTP